MLCFRESFYLFLQFLNNRRKLQQQDNVSFKHKLSRRQLRHKKLLVRSRLHASFPVPPRLSRSTLPKVSNNRLLPEWRAKCLPQQFSGARHRRHPPNPMQMRGRLLLHSPRLCLHTMSSRLLLPRRHDNHALHLQRRHIWRCADQLHQLVLMQYGLLWLGPGKLHELSYLQLLQG